MHASYPVLLCLLLALAMPAVASEQEIRNLIALGALAFADNCRQCHQIDGYGEEELYPSLHDETLLANKALLINTLVHGRVRQRPDHQEPERLMPSMAFLSNREIAAIIAFVSNSWGANVVVVTEEEVANARSSLAQ